MISRHAGDQFRKDVALTAIGRDDALRTRHRQLAGDLKRADAASRDQHPLVSKYPRIHICKGVVALAATCERCQSCHHRECRRTLRPRGYDHLRITGNPRCPVRPSELDYPAASMVSVKAVDTRLQSYSL